MKRQQIITERPIIFFSHSSRDADALGRLKALFTRATGGSIETFLSSDGQSIPLGRNWVHRIEEALDQARLMIVFVTPNSLQSNWIFFESGYAYAKDITVVPVGFLGVDLSKVPPPLGLLQGFNIRSEEGLNNLVAVANETFGHSHIDSFSQLDYQHICGVGHANVEESFGQFGNLVRDVRIELKQADLALPLDRTIEVLRKMLDEQNRPYEHSIGSLELPGVTFTVKETGNLREPVALTIRVDPYVASVNLPIVASALSVLRTAGAQGVQMRLDFVNGVEYEDERHRLTGKLYGTQAKPAEGGRMRFGDLQFKISHLINPGFGSVPTSRGATTLGMTFYCENVPVAQIYELVTLLFRSGVLYSEVTLLDT